MKLFGRSRRHSFAAAILSILLPAAPALALGQFEIHLNPGPTLASTPDALAAFQRAAQEWEQYISTPVRININADIAPNSNPFVIGSTDVFNNGQNNLNLDYTQVRNAMALRTSRPGDAILASLPTTTQIIANVPTGATFLTDSIGITTANQKALGLIDGSPANTSIDASMTFNSNFAFDYDRSNGVDPAKMDFETAATHEIGHVLGFISDTDDFDSFGPIPDNATTLDLFRFNAANLPTTALQFTNTPRELRPGQEASFDDTQVSFAMSTGANSGDGNQASHWQDDFLFDPTTNTLVIGPLIGIMDPSLDFGTVETISNADLRAMELIGYNTTGAVPEPTALAIVGSIAAVAATRRRRNARSC